MATNSNRANKARRQMNARRYKTLLTEALDQGSERKLTLTTADIADHFNAALIAALATDPDNAPKTGPIVGFQWDGADSPVVPSAHDFARYADFSYGHVSPVYQADLDAARDAVK